MTKSLYPKHDQAVPHPIIRGSLNPEPEGESIWEDRVSSPAARLFLASGFGLEVGF